MHKASKIQISTEISSGGKQDQCSTRDNQWEEISLDRPLDVRMGFSEDDILLQVNFLFLTLHLVFVVCCPEPNWGRVAKKLSQTNRQITGEGKKM